MQKAGQDKRHPKVDRVDADLVEEADGREQPDDGRLEGVHQAMLVGGASLLTIALQFVVEPKFFVARKPGGVVGFVLQQEEHTEAHQEAGNAFGEKQPLPTVQVQEALQVQQRAGDGSAHHAGKRGRGHELRNRTCALPRRKPVGQVEDHAGKESGLAHAEQKAQHVKRQRAAHKHHAHGDDAPADHDAGNPFARPDLYQHQVAGQIEQRGAEKEDARAGAVDGVAQARGRASSGAPQSPR